jgi:hypothetical protein
MIKAGGSDHCAADCNHKVLYSRIRLVSLYSGFRAGVVLGRTQFAMSTGPQTQCVCIVPQEMLRLRHSHREMLRSRCLHSSEGDTAVAAFAVCVRKIFYTLASGLTVSSVFFVHTWLFADAQIISCMENKNYG